MVKNKYNNRGQIPYGVVVVGVVVVVVVWNVSIRVRYLKKQEIVMNNMFKKWFDLSSNPYSYVSYYSYSYSYITILSSIVVFVLHHICICICAIYVLIFVFALYMYFYLSRGPAGPPGGPKGPHLVAEGHQPSAGARSLAPVGGQIF